MRSGVGHGLVTRREDACLWIGGADNAPVPVVPGWTTVIVEPGFADWDALVSTLQDSPAPANGWVTLVTGAGGPTGFGARLAGRLDQPVVAPAGDVLRATDGSLFATGGEFWLCPPGRPAHPIGPRWPVPAWQRALDAAPADALPAATGLASVPAGVHLGARPTDPGSGRGVPVGPESRRAVPVGPESRRVGPAGSESRRAIPVGREAGLPGPAGPGSGLEWAVPPDPRVLRLLLDPAVPARTVVAALDAVSGTEVELVPLATGLRAGHAVARAAADALESPVRLFSGVPLRTPDRGDAVFALDDDGTPVWEQPARLLEFRPGAPAPLVVRAGLGQSGLRPVGHDGFALLDGWLVRVVAYGLLLVPTGGPVRTPSIAGDADFEVVVGAAGEPVPDELWPVFATLLARVLVDLPGHARLRVPGEPSSWGRTAAHELAGRHGAELVASGG